MLDRFNRHINYLRVSVTDRCNFRCVYCMPPEGVTMLRHEDILSYDEIVEVCKIATELGVNKIRITGGEPLVRKGIVHLVSEIAKIEGITDLGMTTNGFYLDQFARPLKEAGLMRVNVSLDTLDAEEFSRITRGADLSQVLKGIEAAQKAGLTPVKINTVLFDQKDDQKKQKMLQFAGEHGLEVRFIRQMNLASGEFSVVEGGTGGNCAICNRIRLTANGFIKACLFSDEEYNVRTLGPRKAVTEAVAFKPEKGTTCSHREFYNIGG